jgi:phage virion morphogenesis protein
MIEIKVDDTQITKALEGLVAKMANRRPVMREISHDMLDAVKQRFVDGPGKWPELAKSTVKRYAKKGYSTSPTLNRRSAGLFPSIHPFSNNDTAMVGTNKKYAAIHHFGGEIKQYARSQQVYFKQNKKGVVGNKFVKKSRSNFSQWATRGESKHTMPARPYMYLEESDKQRIVMTMRRYLEGNG